MALDRQVFKSFSDTVLAKTRKDEEDTRNDGERREALPAALTTPRMPINTGASVK